MDFRPDPKYRNCLYEEPKLRKLFPEYADISTDDLIETLYKPSQLTMPKIYRPWRKLGEIVKVALLPPAVAFVLGALFLWALRGFKKAG